MLSFIWKQNIDARGGGGGTRQLYMDCNIIDKIAMGMFYRCIITKPRFSVQRLSIQVVAIAEKSTNSASSIPMPKRQKHSSFHYFLTI